MSRFGTMAGQRAFGVGLAVLFVIILISASAQGAGSNNWRSVGTGDCPGRDIAHSAGPNPDPAKCTDAVRGQTAACWGQGCTYMV
jgi:hypothetical protein